MAKQPAKSDKSTPKKRRIKNPETFRERAQKATDASGQPKPGARLRQAGSQATGPVRRQLKNFFGSKPFAPFRKVLSGLGKVLIPSYFRKSWQELKLVTWPNWTQGRRLTVAVLIFAIVFGVVIAGVDWALDKIFRNLLLT